MSPWCAQRLNMANKGMTKGSFLWRPSAVPALTIFFPGSSCKQDKLSLNYISKHTDTFCMRSSISEGTSRGKTFKPTSKKNKCLYTDSEKTLKHILWIHCELQGHAEKHAATFKRKICCLYTMVFHGSVKKGKKNTVLFLWTHVEVLWVHIKVVIWNMARMRHQSHHYID